MQQSRASREIRFLWFSNKQEYSHFWKWRQHSSNNHFDHQLQQRKRLESYWVWGCHIHQEELDRLRKRFQKIDADSSGKIDKIEFFSIPGVANNPLGMRIMDVLDSDKNGMISFDEFINGLSIFLTANKGGSSVDKTKNWNLHSRSSILITMGTFPMVSFLLFWRWWLVKTSQIMIFRTWLTEP